MSPIIKLPVAGALVLSAFLALADSAMADPKPQCETIAKDVQSSIAKEPSKVLMIVEDALVINEACACEIIKAAISASHADAAMVKQIVQTAVAVAPKMAPVIMECSGTTAVADGQTDVVAKTAATGKDAKNVLPEAVVPPKEGSDYSTIGLADIRGLYLMQPALGGPVVTTTPPHKHHPRKPGPPPMSPSCACVNTPWTP